MFHVFTQTGEEITTGSERIARAFYDAAVRSGRFAVLCRRDGKSLVVVAESA